MKVLVVEDDSETVEFISIAFDIGWPEAELVSCDSGSAAVQIMESQPVDMVLLDLGLPDMSGFDVLRQIRAFSSKPVIIITVAGSERDIVKGLDWGADEYIVKPFGQFELLARVRAMIRARQSFYEGEAPIVQGSFRFDPVSGELSAGPASVHLTRAESFIVRLLMENCGQVVSYDRLAEAVWGDVYSHAADTLRVYIRRLRSKTGAPFQHRFRIESRHGRGYLLVLTG